MRTARPALLACSFLVFLAACEGEKPSEAVPITEVCDAKHAATMVKGDQVTKRISVEGYLALPRGFVVCTDTCGVELRPEPTASSGAVAISLKIGSEQAQMEKLPRNFSEKDLKVHVVGGGTVGAGDSVRITGERLGLASEKSCQIVGVDKVEKR